MKITWCTGVLAALASISEAAPQPARGGSPSVESRKLRSFLKESALVAKGQLLQDFAYSHEGRNRYIGSPGHQKTVDYVVETLEGLKYYDVYTQEFTVPSSSATLKVNNATVETAPMSFSAGGNPTAPLVVVANVGCDAADFPVSVAGAIALVSRGSCTFKIKTDNAKAAGAVGTIVYNNVEGVVQGTLGEVGDYVPTVGISQADGLAFVAAINGNSTLTATINAIVRQITTYNVIAETKCGDKDNVLSIGAHSDSVAAGPGINDNGSGSVGILEVAIQLAKFTTENAVRFSWWSAEEEGLLGSEYYVANLTDAERQKIRLYLNFDMIASPNYVYEIYDGDGSAYNISGPPGSDTAELLFQEYFTNVAKLPWTAGEFSGRSDYGPFLEYNIASGGLAAGADGIKTEEEAVIFGGTAGLIYDPNYHTVNDTLANSNSTAWIETTRGIAHAVATYGASWEGFPAKPATKKRDIVKRGTTKALRKGGKWIS